MKKFIIVTLCCVFAFFLLSYKMTEVPPGINGDEAGIGYNAILISRNFTDENNNFLPLFIFAKSSDWKQPVTVYATAFFFRLFGSSYWLLRATSVFFVILSLIILYLIFVQFGGIKFFLTAAFILVTTPIVLIQAHLALENIAPLPFVLFWLWGLLKYEKTKRKIYLGLAGISLGTGLFSYLGMRLVVPILVLLTGLYLRKTLKGLTAFLIGAAPFFLLLWVAYFRYPGAVLGNYNAPLPGLYEFFLRYLSNFDVSFLFYKGDATAIHSTGKAGMFLASSLPLFLLGTYRIILSKKPLELLIVLAFFLSPLLFGLVPDVYRASRLLTLVPFYVVISTIGYFSITKNFWKLLIIFIMLSNYGYFVKDYWYDYPNRVEKVFPIQIERTYEFRIKDTK